MEEVDAAAAAEATDLDALRALTGADAPAPRDPAAEPDGGAEAAEEAGLGSVSVPDGYVVDEEVVEEAPAQPAASPSPSPQPPAKKPPPPPAAAAAVRNNPSLPAYASSPFYNDALYKCRPTGRLSFNIPTVEKQPTGDDGRELPRVSCVLYARGWPATGNRVPVHHLPLNTRTRARALTTVAGQSWSFAYGRYDMAWPRMLRPEFSDWFRRYEINNWRANT